MAHILHVLSRPCPHTGKTVLKISEHSAQIPYRWQVIGTFCPAKEILVQRWVAGKCAHYEYRTYQCSEQVDSCTYRARRIA